MLQQKKLTRILNKINLNLFLKNKKLFFLVIFLTSFFLPFYTGYKGIFPIDSFLIFDSGYKVLNNIHPFKDYWSITGPFLDYIQSTLFLIFKVNWFSYVLHSALVNSLLALVSFYLFLNIGLSIFYSGLYALSISILAYPSAGTPFMDHHAVIFALLSVNFLILALIKDKKKFWFLSSLFIVFSFFCKQVPSAYLGILILLIFLIYIVCIKEKKKNNFMFIFFGGASGILFFLIIALINKIPIQSFLLQYIYYPLTIGESRNVNLSFDFKNIFLQFKFIYLSIFPGLIGGFFLINKKIKNRRNKVDLLILILSTCSVLIFIHTQLLTKNQVLIFLLIPFCLAISHFFVSSYFNKKILLGFIILLLILTTAKYHLRYNEHRYFMELSNIDFNKSIDAKILDERLSGLKWISPKYANDPALELKLLIDIKRLIKADINNKIIVSDYQILPSITKNLNYAPNKWFDELSVPSKESKYFKEYKLFFINKLEEQKIVNIYVVGKEKLNLLLNVFEDKNCIQFSELNDISIKLNISKCL